MCPIRLRPCPRAVLHDQGFMTREAAWARLPQDIVGQQEGVLQRSALSNHIQQPVPHRLVSRDALARVTCGTTSRLSAPVVGDDDQRVDVGAQGLNPVRGLHIKSRKARAMAASLWSTGSTG